MDVFSDKILIFKYRTRQIKTTETNKKLLNLTETVVLLLLLLSLYLLLLLLLFSFCIQGGSNEAAKEEERQRKLENNYSKVWSRKMATRQETKPTDEE